MGWIGCAIWQVSPKRHPRFFSKFQDMFFKDFIKNPQTTFALTCLTHIISGIDGVILMSIILNHKSNQCSSLQQCILTFFFHSSQCIQIFFESIVGKVLTYAGSFNLQRKNIYHHTANPFPVMKTGVSL